MSARPEPDLEVSPEETVRALREDRAQLVDVREPYEYEAGRIEGALHVELGQLAAAAPTLDPERPVIFQCRVGGRSAMAAQAFRAAGYDAYSLRGGLLAWHAAGLPLVPEGGTVAPH
ncbi:MAG: rhodanese-like domain-containing protein [Actinomycetota bacterium]|jgi:rhodanese-related sulfurtransferase|nr:rhodanese-like domain-containing protein [Actinomycetota bacterium]